MKNRVAVSVLDCVRNIRRFLSCNAAFIIAVCALGVSVYQGVIQHSMFLHEWQQNRLSVRPVLNFSVVLQPDGLHDSAGLYMENLGLGPALLGNWGISFKLTTEEQAFIAPREEWQKFLFGPLNYFTTQKYPGSPDLWTLNKISILEAGGRQLLFGFSWEQMNATNTAILKDLLPRISFTVPYQSLYKEEFHSDVDLGVMAKISNPE